MRRAFAAVASSLFLLTASAAAQGPQVGNPILTGQFTLAGRVTVAKNIKGERVGEQFGRTWTFTPQCPGAACTTVKLVRPRAGGSDTVLLHKTAPGDYAGSGSFYAPLRCAGRTYRRGEFVPFKITVTVTAAAARSNLEFATRISATYTNRYRKNLTACVQIPGHDAASYHGHLLPSPSGGGGL
jgi:hypothetical protein